MNTKPRPRSKSHYDLGTEMYKVSDQEFKDRITKRKYRRGKITKDNAFVELI